MGYAMAKNCALRGAQVTLVSGPTALEAPMFVETVPVVSAADMAEAVITRAEEQDIIIMTAAVADFCPADPKTEKIKKQDGKAASVIELARTQDILAYLGEHRRPGQFLCGFSMETEHMLENSRAKLEKKHVDMIVANNLKVAGAGFGTDTNVVTMITQDSCRELSIRSKEEVAEAVISEIVGCC
jgi:phosphopantothenoylcysteine decarboxylase/phosphopantothenate--cysteine ligase